MSKLKKLKNLTKEEYDAFKAFGVLWEFFPEASGNWEKDTNNEKKNESVDSLRILRDCARGIPEKGA